jgi:hypothetical protein
MSTAKAGSPGASGSEAAIILQVGRTYKQWVAANRALIRIKLMWGGYQRSLNVSPSATGQEGGR